jgi:hypothetical protein
MEMQFVMSLNKNMFKSLNDFVSLPMGNQGTVVVLDLYGS